MVDNELTFSIQTPDDFHYRVSDLVGEYHHGMMSLEEFEDKLDELVENEVFVKMD